MEDYIKTKNKRNWNSSAYNNRIKEYAIQGLQDLQFITEEVNKNNGFKQRDVEKILEEVFEPNKVETFLKSVLFSKHINETTQLKIAKAMVEMIPEIAQQLCNEDYQKLMLSGHDRYRASLYAIKWATE